MYSKRRKTRRPAFVLCSDNSDSPSPTFRVPFTATEKVKKNKRNDARKVTADVDVITIPDDSDAEDVQKRSGNGLAKLPVPNSNHKINQSKSKDVARGGSTSTCSIKTEVAPMIRKNHAKNEGSARTSASAVAARQGKDGDAICKIASVTSVPHEMEQASSVPALHTPRKQTKVVTKEMVAYLISSHAYLKQENTRMANEQLELIQCTEKLSSRLVNYKKDNAELKMRLAQLENEKKNWAERITATGSSVQQEKLCDATILISLQNEVKKILEQNEVSLGTRVNPMETSASEDSRKVALANMKVKLMESLEENSASRSMLSCIKNLECEFSHLFSEGLKREEMIKSELGEVREMLNKICEGASSQNKKNEQEESGKNEVAQLDGGGSGNKRKRNEDEEELPVAPKKSKIQLSSSSSEMLAKQKKKIFNLLENRELQGLAPRVKK